jgi:hypothetical protein
MLKDETEKKLIKKYFKKLKLIVLTHQIHNKGHNIEIT